MILEKGIDCVQGVRTYQVSKGVGRVALSTGGGGCFDTAFLKSGGNLYCPRRIYIYILHPYHASCRVRRPSLLSFSRRTMGGQKTEVL